MVNLQERTHAKVWFQKSCNAFSCKFVAYFQNNLLQEDFWVTAAKLLKQLYNTLILEI